MDCTFERKQIVFAAQTWTTAMLRSLFKNGFPFSIFHSHSLIHSLECLYMRASTTCLYSILRFYRSMLLFDSCTKVNNLNAFVWWRASTNAATTTNTTTQYCRQRFADMVWKKKQQTNGCINVWVKRSENGRIHCLFKLLINDLFFFNFIYMRL